MKYTRLKRKLVLTSNDIIAGNAHEKLVLNLILIFLKQSLFFRNGGLFTFFIVYAIFLMMNECMLMIFT